MVASFREPFKAHLASGRLKAEGIQAVVLDEHLVRLDWVLSQAIGGVKIQVPEANLEEARKVLEADCTQELLAIEGDQADAPPDALCPRCGSGLISSHPYSPWSIVPSIFFLLPLFFRWKKWVCGDCGNSW